ncbi:MAG: winged helix-turn-helix domain-containing protein, partial [Candidatus Heimdallarchaeota archaeon]
LGLNRINVLAFVNSIEKLRILELASDEHPYTHYRARAYGGQFGLFMQFDAPEKATSQINDFFRKLVKENIVLHYELLPSIGIRNDIYADLSRYNAKMSSWTFSWEDWFTNLEKEKSSIPDKQKISEDFTVFQQSHFKILRMLTANASIKQTEIIEKLKLSRTQTHREYNYVMEKYIERIRFIYNREIFDLTETYIAIGSDLDKNKSDQIFSTINNNPPPFRLALDLIENNKILLWGNMTPAQASGFAFSMWRTISSTQIYTLYTKKSRLYWFYPENFDFQAMEWKSSKDYVIKDPLNRTLSK